MSSERLHHHFVNSSYIQRKKMQQIRGSHVTEGIKPCWIVYIHRLLQGMCHGSFGQRRQEVVPEHASLTIPYTIWQAVCTRCPELRLKWFLCLKIHERFSDIIVTYCRRICFLKWFFFSLTEKQICYTVIYVYYWIVIIMEDTTCYYCYI